MAFPIRFWAVLLAGLLIYQFSTTAAANNCKYQKEISLKLDLTDSILLSIAAGAGDLNIRGTDGTHEAVVLATACVSKQEWLDQVQIETVTGKEAQINVNLPDSTGGWALFGSNYAYLDLTVEVPSTLALDVRDSSGDATFTNIGSMDLQDSSGHIEISTASGPVTIKDSSGDIEMKDIHGAVTIRDSSGDIDVVQVDGNFTIVADSSGDIRANNINGEVLVRKDSSGDIRATEVTESFIVEVDSSGDIIARDVGGDFRVHSNGSGTISSENIGGAIELPQN